MRANLLCCLLVVTLIALWAGSNRPSSDDLRLRLLLSKQPINSAFVEGNCFSLELQNGQVHSSSRRDGVIAPGPDRRLQPEQVAQLNRQLHQAGAWDLTDADSHEPEEKVLYTYLEVREGDQPPHSSHWRGLPPPQAACARVLLQAPFGSDIHTALQAL